MNITPHRLLPSLVASAGTLIAASLTAGCAAAPSAANFSVRTLAMQPSGDVESAVRTVLLRRDFVVVVAETAGPRFVALPRDHRPQSDSRRTRLDIRIAEVGGARKIFCRAEVQRQSTEARRIIALDTAIDDQPGATPLQREGATTVEQNTVWDTIGRDRTLEREIVNDLADALGGAPASAPK